VNKKKDGTPRRGRGRKSKMVLEDGTEPGPPVKRQRKTKQRPPGAETFTRHINITFFLSKNTTKNQNSDFFLEFA